jgi:predicted metalloenzyme YecM
MNTISDIIGDYKKFLDDVYKNLEELKISVVGFPIDHIVYRTTTKERYEAIRKQLLQFGKIISEIIIRERPVAIIKLNEPLMYKGMKISYFEILAPAKGDTFSEGLEHAEFVINIEFSKITEKYPSVNFIFNDKKINPELILKFPNNANVKFHELPINEVIKLQN